MNINFKKIINSNKILKDSIRKLRILRRCNIKLNPFLNDKIKLIELYNFIFLINKKLKFCDTTNLIANNIYKFLDDKIIDILSINHNFIPEEFKNYYCNNIRMKRLDEWRNNLKIGDYCDARDSKLFSRGPYFLSVHP